ncbi:aldehyde dehydrogenase [Amycolatopsis sp. NPDC005232]|uniref:aldehyde dehydrogenase n=1 Tax=Amycolatopsis sp. NPDC005232 TaxID=3157027 RepID=UPI0033B7B695
MPSSEATITVVSPNTGVPIGSVAEAREADVDAAVAAARVAFDGRGAWPRLSCSNRAAAMRRFAEQLDLRKDEFARAVSAQNGMPIAVSSQVEAAFPATLLRYYADLIEAQQDDRRSGLFGGTVDVLREPVGVVAAIAPWNFPQTMAFCKIAPALAAGCTVVLKPSPETVYDAVLLGEAAAAAELPAGVLNIVPAGRDVGAYLVAHPGVDKVAFTGSTAAGRQVAETCGRLLRPVSLELGGKSAAIILEDAVLDLGTIGADLFGATFANNGQTCYLSTRILAPASRHSEVVEAITEFASSLRIGESLDPDTQIGPLAGERHRERVEGYITKGRADGGKITTGGRRPADRSAGWFVEPTVFTDLDAASAVAQDEIFGPVVVVLPYTDEDDAVRIANESSYGLAGSVWTADPGRGRALARRMHTGSVGINGYVPDPVGPIGGVKNSGIGRELGPEGLASYQNLKSVFS